MKFQDILALAPEQVVLRFSNGGSEKQSEIEALLKDLSPEAQRTLADSSLKDIVESYTRDSKTDWTAVHEKILQKELMGRALFGERYDPLMSDIANHVKKQRRHAVTRRVIVAIGVGTAGYVMSQLGESRFLLPIVAAGFGLCWLELLDMRNRIDTHITAIRQIQDKVNLIEMQMPRTEP